MKQAYDADALEKNTDFFDRVWEASVMKVGNLKKQPHIASFIASAATESTTTISMAPERTMVSVISKACSPLSGCDIYKLSSTITVILAYFKLVDNIHDSRFVKRILLYLIYPYFAFIKNKAKKKYPDIFSIVEDGMTAQFKVEKCEKSSLDLSAHNTANILGKLFSYNEQDENGSYNFGYHLGRVVYFLDAFDDYSDDMKAASFNPFRNCEHLINDASQTINLSISELANILNQQELYDFKPIIENVIYDGLNFQLEKIKNKHGGVKSE